MFALSLFLLLAFVALTAARFAQAAGEGPHPFSVHDMLAMDRISDPQASPDGRCIVFAVRVTDLEANKGCTDLWLVHTDGTGLRRLTTHPAGSSHPRWAADGKAIYFLSARCETMQVWKIAADGGEAEPVTHLPLEVGCFALSPDGQHLAVALEVFLDAPQLADTKTRLDARAKRKATGQLFERLFVRHWDTWKDGRRAHLFVLPTAGGGDPIDVMKGMDADVPSKPFGGPEEFTFTPDGQGLVFSARQVGREEAWSTQFDLYAVPSDGPAAPEKLTEGNRATITQPVFSPDGRTLAYLAMARPGYESDRFRIVLRPWPKGQARVLTEAWDRSPGKIVWSKNGKTIYTYAEQLGQRPLFGIDVGSGEVRTVVGEGRVTEIVVAGDGLVYGLCHLRSPVELYSLDPVQGSRPITQINSAKVAAARMGTPEQFTFQGWNDETVYAYVVRPVDFDPQKQYPVAFLVHGGPQGSFGVDFHYRWNAQAYAGAGYAVVMVDFHGSTGYGQAFTDAINGHWGERPLEDLQKGLTAALARYPWMNGQRVAALGASYGGYMINWIHGNWPDRFRCFVCHDGNLDERMAYYDTEELWFPEWERGGTPWDKAEAYTEHNPIDHVGSWKTPTLVIHGGRDYRVVDSQGLSTFTALQRRGIPSQLLHFPDENHWVLKPANSIQWHETVIAWLDRWLKE